MLTPYFILDYGGIHPCTRKIHQKGIALCVSVDSQAFVVIVYVCLIFNNFSNFQGSALSIYSAVLRKSMNETVFLKIK